MFFKRKIFYIPFLSIVGIVCIATMVFLYSVLQKIDLNRITQTTQPYSQFREKKDLIDQGVFLKKELLSNYWVWSDSSIGFDNFLKANESKIKKLRDGYFFEEEVELPETLINDCEKVYCLQSRLLFPNIPSLLWRGLIGIEDYRFLKHPGIDLRSLFRALWHDIKVGRLEQGGSTLTQQLVKNIFYTNERKFSRKIKEMIASAYIESKLNKEEILQAYFNEVVWGSFQGIKIKGIASASLFYFNKKPTALEPFEVAILISLLKGPYFYSPLNHPDRLRKRVSVVFKKLKELSLYPDKASIWEDEKWNNWIAFIKKTAESRNLRSLFLLSREKREARLFQNYVLINEAEELKKSLKKKYAASDFAIKMIRMNLSEESKSRTFSYYSKFERDLANAIDKEPHNVGSTLKPIIYGLLNTQGLTLDQEVETAPITLKLKSGAWTPREAHVDKEKMITYKKALIKSYNRPVIRAVKNFGFDKFEEIFKQVIPQLKVPLSEYPAQLLGSVEMPLKDLANVYGDFLVSSCWKGFGSEVLEALSDPLNTTIRYRVGEKLGQMKFFGKTGTSNGGFDNWFVGFDGRELLITWVGLEGNRGENKEFRLYGSSTAFVIYKNYYEKRGKLFNEMVCQAL